MNQLEQSKIIDDLNKNILLLKETIKQQEELLFQLLTEYDKNNSFEYELEEEILDYEEN